MAKVVSSKFGDRQLVQLPPVSFSRSRSAEVPSIVPNHYSDRRSVRGGDTDRSSVLAGQYGYNAGRTSADSPSVGQAQGNIVRDINNPGVDFKIVQPSIGATGPSLHYTPHALGQVQQVPQQSSSQPQTQAPAIPQTSVVPTQPAPVASNVTAQFQGADPNEKHIYYGPNGEVLPGPPPGFQTAQFQGSNPNEKHIYYGPNGEVLSGPPQNFQMLGSRPNLEPLREFVVDVVLEYGRVKTVSNLDYTGQFPRFPEYLLNALRQKYGQFERTDARIAYRAGEFNVHGVPYIPMQKPIREPPPPVREQPEYGEPVEIVEYIYPDDEDYEEIRSKMEKEGGVYEPRPESVIEDRGRKKHTHRETHITTLGDRGHRRFISPVREREDRSYTRYAGPWTAQDYRFGDRGHRRRDIPRTATGDPLEGLRWKKERASIVDDKKYKF